MTRIRNIRIIKSAEELNELKVFWNKSLLYSTFSSWEWVFYWWKFLRKKEEGLKIFFAQTKSDWIILPFKCLGNKKLEFVCSRKTDYNYPLERLENTSLEDYKLIYFELFSILLEKHDQILLNNLPDDTLLGKLLVSQKGPFLTKIVKKESCPFVDLKNFSFQLMDKNYREDIKRCLEKIGKVKHYICEDCKEFDLLLNKFFRLNKEWWSRKGYEGLIKSEKEELFFKNVLPPLFRKNKILFSLIFLKNDILSILLSFVYNSSIYYYSSAHNVKYKSYSPGKIHLYLLFNYALKNGFQKFDFMRGDELYKYRWLARDRYNYTVVLKK
jgi:CelD/BcsL family acetyltransferase involved in cellulose biosynthesis